MSEMIERVARALCDHDYGQPMWERLPETEAEALRQYRAGKNESCGYRGSYRADARVAIEAMREPTEELRAAGRDNAADELVWSRLIDVILPAPPDEVEGQVRSPKGEPAP